MENKEKLIYQIRQLFASIVWTHKIQEKESYRNNSYFRIMQFVQIALLSLTASGIFTSIFIDYFVMKLISAVFSGLSLFVGIYLETSNYRERAKSHKSSAIKLFELREKTISFLTDITMGKLDEEQIIEIREKYYEEYFSICRITPDAHDSSVKKASYALKTLKDNTYTNEEIDSYLPFHLRITK